MQEGIADATDLATLQSIQTELTDGFAALPADVQAQLQGAFDKLIAGLEAIKSALTTMIGGTTPVPPTTPTEPTAPTAPTEPTAPTTPAAPVIPAVQAMRSQLKNINRQTTRTEQTTRRQGAAGLTLMFVCFCSCARPSQFVV